MTRTEQIKEAAYQYSEHFLYAKNASFVSFEAGVKWSEQNQGSVDWQQVRIQAAIAAMQGILVSPAAEVMTNEEVALYSVNTADALVEALKGDSYER